MYKESRKGWYPRSHQGHTGGEIQEALTVPWGGAGCVKLAAVVLLVSVN